MGYRRIEYKTCTRCGFEKPTTEFRKRNASRDGLDSSCKVCSDETVRRSILKRPPMPPEGKPCTKCGVIKGPDDFPRNRRSGDGFHHTCKACMKINFAAYQADPENKARINESRRKRYRHKREHIADTAKRKTLRLPRNWSYEAALKAQGGGCAICGRTDNPGKFRLAVDHCHATGQFRGLLCTCCNQALGQLKDSEELLTKAIAYLKNPPGLAGWLATTRAAAP